MAVVILQANLKFDSLDELALFLLAAFKDLANGLDEIVNVKPGGHGSFQV